MKTLLTELVTSKSCSHQADADNDDAISLTEFRTLMQELKQTACLPLGRCGCFAKVDADHNGRISLAEFPQLVAHGSAIA
jgi:Ca2+-binding EF-hand superfamily protein